jgi:hypothetical protein
MTKKQVNESIRIAKEGIEECWGDMDMATPAQQSEGPMTVSINMPGKNISVTTDSVDEIANMLKLAGIEISGIGAEEAPTSAMPTGEPEVAYVGVGAEGEPSVPADQVPGDVDGDGDHDMADHEAEAEQEEPEEEGEEETKEAVGDVSYTSKGGKVTQTATGLKHQAGSGVYGGTETDAEEEERKKKMDQEVDESALAEIAALRKYAGLGEGKKPDFLDVDKDGDKEEPMADAAKDAEEEEVKEDSVVGQGVYEGESYADELGRIMKLSGFAESKLMNSPEGTSMDEPTEFDSLPSGKGDGAGRKEFGMNRANGQGENPMGESAVEESLEQKFQSAMGEYRKFVAENISRKK